MTVNAGHPVIVVGSHGWAGRTHTRIHEANGQRVWGVDAAADPTAAVPPTSIWRDAIVDVCTPTAVHGDAVVDAYRRGARRFIVEKPQETSRSAWLRLQTAVPGAQLLSVHNYVWSEAFQRALESVRDVARIESDFDKDRLLDDRRGRGAHGGRLAHVLHVEAPHQFSMAMAVCPELRVVSAEVDDDRHRGCHGNESRAAASVRLESPAGTQAILRTDLRAPKRRTLRLVDSADNVAEVEFAAAGLDPSTVRIGRSGRPTSVLWRGTDDALGHNLRTAVRSFDDAPPHPLTTAFTTRVLGCVEDALDLELDNAA